MTSKKIEKNAFSSQSVAYELSVFRTNPCRPSEWDCVCTWAGTVGRTTRSGDGHWPIKRVGTDALVSALHQSVCSANRQSALRVLHAQLATAMTHI
ncbi:hypothetical protein K4A87_08960 [Xanthomonas fragariae]|uniref:hypothetical protein n=1 Tax=Xanthomonas fragariae TaxID=48664 RepID=UPI001ABE7A85|nr:hypothetical protein [Xanthomonas fragariae]UKR53926.1 hypothetical protein K4A87_08960 [Xanthomonas fragariae]